MTNTAGNILTSCQIYAVLAARNTVEVVPRFKQKYPVVSCSLLLKRWHPSSKISAGFTLTNATGLAAVLPSTPPPPPPPPPDMKSSQTHVM